MDATFKCVADPDINNYALVASTDDVGEGNSLGGGIPSGACGTYTFYGQYTADSDNISLSDSIGISVPHYQVRILFWAILIDRWDNDDFA